MAPEDIAAVLEGDVEIDAMHEAATSQGQSTRPDRDDDVNTHFICFVEKDGQVYELDGRKACPINHGPSSGSLLDDSCRIIRTNFMDADPGELRFTILALARADAS
jgi:ubiquitin carboxyl-terminal hydrolase L3